MDICEQISVICPRVQDLLTYLLQMFANSLTNTVYGVNFLDHLCSK